MEPSLPRPEPPRSPAQRVRDWVEWFGTGRLVATALAVFGVFVGGVWLLRGSPAPPEATLPYASRPTASGMESTVAITTSTVTTEVVVYVAGHVVAPGVYTLPAPARADDAVRAAGGPAADADLDVVNLAALVHDGERIYVPAVGEQLPPDAPPGTTSTTPTFPVNINTATADQLDVLPGVGPATAAAIIARRQEHGPFQSVDELADVRGIGPAKLDAIRALVTV